MGRRLEKVLGYGLGALVLLACLSWGAWRIYSVFFWSGPRAAGASCTYNAGCKSSWCSKLTAQGSKFADSGHGYCARRCERDDQCGRADLRCLQVEVGEQRRCVRVAARGGGT